MGNKMNDQNNSSAPELLPCPFCGGAARIESNRDWHKLRGDHDDDCVFVEPVTLQVPATDEQLAALVADWNRRATQEPADRVQGGLTEAECAVIEDAAKVLESASKHNHEHGRTVFAHSQQARANELRAILSRQSMMGGEVRAATCVNCGSTTTEACNSIGCGGLEDGNCGTEPQEQVEHPSHETIISEGGKLICTACGITTPANAAAANGDGLAHQQPALTVWYGDMPESNGKSNFTAILMRKHGNKLDNMTNGITIDRSEYPDRVRYEADRVRYLIGELTERPFILDYDADKHSGYVRPDIAAADADGQKGGQHG